MRRYLSLVVAATLIGGGLAGCDAFSSDDDEGGIVTLTGRVLNLDTNAPISGASVRVLPYDLIFETTSTGTFTAQVEIDSTMQLQLMASKQGFGTDATTVFAISGYEIEVATLRLRQSGTGEEQEEEEEEEEEEENEPASGSISNILLLAQSAQSIGVKESGSKEVAEIVFQAADSLGRPVAPEYATELRFSFGAQPGGGEFLSPTTARTDENGEVKVNLSSGTKAGVVQIVAETTVHGQTIRSRPVSVSIHGGLPDEDHFSLGPARFNFPGLLAYGVQNEISVIVGDKYGNPARPGTSVYFTSNYGVIEGSTLTSASGQGSATLLSANPIPPDGIATVTATTADENHNTIAARIPVVFTGTPVISVSPSRAELGTTYSLSVSDPNGNPLVQGTSISVRAEGTKVKAVGNTSVTLGRTSFRDGNGDGDILDYEDVVRGPGITQFTFRAVHDASVEEVGDSALEAITIQVSGENGNLEIVLTPQGNVLSSTRNAVVESVQGGTATVRLKDF